MSLKTEPEHIDSRNILTVAARSFLCLIGAVFEREVKALALQN